MHLQEDLLHDVLALCGIQRNPKGDGKNLFAKPANHQLKGPFVAPLQSQNKLIIVHDSVLYGFRHRSRNKVQYFLGFMTAVRTGVTPGIGIACSEFKPNRYQRKNR